jgi:hypothetical protein
MNPQNNKTCADFESWLVKKVAGELLSEEKQFLETHLARCTFCVAKERELVRGWQRFDAFPVPEIPTALYEKTRATILDHLRQEQFRWTWLRWVPSEGVWSPLAPSAAGLVTAGVSFALIRNLIDLRVHSGHILTALFGLWAVLFAGSFWPILGGKGKKFPLPDAVASFAISITLLTLLISYLSSAVDLIRWPVMSAAYEVALVSNYFFGIGNTFVASWWIYACVASFIGAFIFGFRRGPALPQKALLGSFLVTALLSPAIYLHGSSHGHTYGILVFAALGTFVGALIGIGMGSFIRCRSFLSTA